MGGPWFYGDSKRERCERVLIGLAHEIVMGATTFNAGAVLFRGQVTAYWPGTRSHTCALEDLPPELIGGMAFLRTLGRLDGKDFVCLDWGARYGDPTGTKFGDAYSFVFQAIPEAAKACV